jgi:hypothetical protein
MCPGFSVDRHPLTPDDWRVSPLAELPAFLRQQGEGVQIVDLPEEGYLSELGGLPRWVLVMDLTR